MGARLGSGGRPRRKVGHLEGGPAKSAVSIAVSVGPESSLASPSFSSLTAVRLFFPPEAMAATAEWAASASQRASTRSINAHEDFALSWPHPPIRSTAVADSGPPHLPGCTSLQRRANPGVDPWSVAPTYVSSDWIEGAQGRGKALPRAVPPHGRPSQPPPRQHREWCRDPCSVAVWRRELEEGGRGGLSA